MRWTRYTLTQRRENIIRPINERQRIGRTIAIHYFANTHSQPLTRSSQIKHLGWTQS